jgi:hypothetical protein
MNPPVFELEVVIQSKPVQIVVHADWFEDDDLSNDRIETALRRSNECRSLNYWLGLYELRLVQATKAAIDPFETFHDDLKAKGAIDEEIAKEWIKTRSPRERNKLLQGGDDAIQSLIRKCTNLRQARKKAAKR